MLTSVAQRRPSANGILLTTSLVTSACVRHLPPAPTPEAVPPAVDTSAPIPDGHGRLVLDVVDGPTPIHRVHLTPSPVTDAQGRVSYVFAETSEPLCAPSPCVADVPTGNLLLGFPIHGKGSLEVELVHVGPDPSVYRRSLGEYHDDTGALRVTGIVATSVGAAALITGVVLLPVGLGNDNDDLATAGGITLGVGALLTAFGIWAIRRDAPTYRPGSANHFALP